MTDTPRKGRHFKADPHPAPAPGRETGSAAMGAPAAGNPYAAVPRKRCRRGMRVVSTILLVVGVVLIVAAAGIWLNAQRQYRAQDETNERLAAFAQVSDDPSQAPTVDWDALDAINGDAVGWVQIPGTVVNYPVYQGKDNERYLNTNAYGTYGVGGQIFMDYENQRPGVIDAQTLVYGHHLKNGRMFALVDDMCDQATFDAHDTVWYVTRDAPYELEPLFVYRTDGNDANARQLNFSSPEELRTYLTGLLGRSAARRADAEAAIQGVTHVVTLATCDYVVAGVPTEIGGRALLVCGLKNEVQAATAASGQ